MPTQQKPIIHGGDHLPGHADPIPGLPTPYGDDVVGLILATGPAGFWKLDELVGTTAHDSSGNGHDMEPPAGLLPPTWGEAAGPTGLTSAKWPVSGTVLYREHVTMTAFTNNFTAGVWFNALTNHGNSNLFGQGQPFEGGGGAGVGWALTFVPGTGNLYGCGGTDPVISSGTMSLATWYFAALVRDAGTWKLYVNGVLQADTSTASPGAGSTDTWLGDDPSGTSNWSEDVLLSCAFVTPEVMTSTELLAIYESGITGGAVAAQKVWTALGDGTADWRDPTILVEY